MLRKGFNNVILLSHWGAQQASVDVQRPLSPNTKKGKTLQLSTLTKMAKLRKYCSLSRHASSESKHV